MSADRYQSIILRQMEAIVNNPSSMYFFQTHAVLKIGEHHSDIAPSEIATSDIATSDIAPSDIAPSDIATSDIVPSDILGHIYVTRLDQSHTSKNTR